MNVLRAVRYNGELPEIYKIYTYNTVVTCDVWYFDRSNQVKTLRLFAEKERKKNQGIYVQFFGEHRFFTIKIFTNQISFL